MCARYFDRYFLYIGISLSTLLLTSCSPSGENPTDVFPNAAAVIKPTNGPDSFLLFPNPQKQDDGSLQTNTLAYATAYYEAIDPNNEKNTLAKWKTANGFGSIRGTEVSVVFGDVKDLGYGRRMTARDNGNDTYAFMVENYSVAPAANYGYSSFNLDAAVARDPRWHVSTNAIEFSGAACTAAEILAGCSSIATFAKFYTFHPTTGARLLEANLDGRGNKAMPGVCISCHGGRADPLTPATESPTGKALFPVIGFTASKKRGDVEAHLQPFDVDSFSFSTVPGHTRADQEDEFKVINQMVLSTYPIPATTTFPEDRFRRISNPIEWDATPAATLIKNAYGGDEMGRDTYSDAFVPPTGWLEQTALYNNVVIPACRTCHILRGTRTMPDLNFNSYAAFSGYADQIKGHVIDRGNMPLAKIIYERLWGSSGIATLADFLVSAEQTARDTSGAVLKPGRPVAVPGPDRITTSGSTLSAAGSLYADNYSWSIVFGIGGSLTNPTSATPTLNGQSGTTYVLQLVASKGTTQSAPARVSVTIASVGPSLPIAPTAIRFADIKAVLQGCTGSGCHSPGGGPPIFYTDIDRNGSGGIADTIDDRWFYTELRGRINFTDVASSALLRKPSGYHHGGGLRTGFDLTTTPGQLGRANYDLFLNWILNGARDL